MTLRRIEFETVRDTGSSSQPHRTRTAFCENPQSPVKQAVAAFRIPPETPVGERIVAILESVARCGTRRGATGHFAANPARLTVVTEFIAVKHTKVVASRGTKIGVRRLAPDSSGMRTMPTASNKAVFSDVRRHRGEGQTANLD